MPTGRVFKKAAYAGVLALILATFVPQSGPYGAAQGIKWGPSMAFAAKSAPVVGMSANDAALTVKALQAAAQGSWSYAESLIAQTRDPLAARIYYWMYYTQKAAPHNFRRISTFVGQIPNWPRQGALRLSAEKSASSDTPIQDVVEWFNTYKPQTADGMMLYLSALRAAGANKDIPAILNTWWAETAFGPESQDKFLRTWGKTITREAHIKRLNMLLSRDYQSAARGIANILGRGYPQLAEARIALAAMSPGVDSVVARVPANLQNDPGLMLERLRWRRKKDMDFKAIEILHSAPAAYTQPDPDAWWRERHIMVRRLIERKQYESAYLLAAKHGTKQGASFADAEFVAGWLALRFVKRPWEAFEHFERLYHNSAMPITRGRAAFWAGMASEALGHKDIARKWYEAGAVYSTTFYGQMALGKLGRDDTLVTAMPDLTMQARTAFEKHDMVQAARLFKRAGLNDYSSSFLRAFAVQAKTHDDFHLAADLATEFSQPDTALAVAKEAQKKGYVLADFAFPTMLSRMKNVDTEWALVHGIIKQESAFDTKAQSPAGARGLMQLMPATAKETAKKAGMSHQTDWLTARPDHNVKLGALYIDQMLRRYDGHYPLAIAAYNAGPGRVSQWLVEFGDPRKGEIDMLDWIEIIPVAETRNYIQRVMEGVFVYRHKFAKVQKTSNAPIHISYLQPLNGAESGRVTR